MSVFLTSAISIDDCGFKKIIAIPQKRLINLIKEVPDQNISFTIKETKSKTATSIIVTIECSTGKYNLPVEAGENYPMIKLEDPITFKMYAESLMVGIDKTVFASHPDITNALGGIHTELEGKQISYAACDAMILSTTTYELEEEIPTDTKILVPARVLSVLRTIAYVEYINVSISQRSIQFIMNDSIVIIAMLIENKFPNYKVIIPTNYTDHLAIDKQLLLGSAKRVSQFADDNNNTIIVDLQSNALKISSRNDLDETAFEELPVQYEGNPIVISLNGKNLVTCLTKLNSDEVHFSFGSEKMPALLREDDSDLGGQKNLMLLMPIVFEEKAV